MEDNICVVSIDQIRVSPFQPRRLFSEEEIDELANSIKEVGIIQPPVVRKIMKQGEVLYYELIAGERRLRASKRANLASIGVIVREITDEKAAKTTLIENVQRVDLNPIETALALKRLMDVFQMTQEEVAERVGKKRSTVANYLRLLALPDKIQESLMLGEISMGHAKAILSLTNDELKRKLHKLIVESQITVRDAEKQSLKIAREAKQKKGDKDLHAQDLAERLGSHLSTKVEITSIRKGSKGGKVIIHYYHLDDLDRLIDTIGLHNS